MNIGVTWLKTLRGGGSKIDHGCQELRCSYSVSCKAQVFIFCHYTTNI